VKRVRIIAFAYACEPDAGSEPGAGWGWVRMLGTFADVWVITRENNRPAIEAALPTLPERDALHFVYVDLPPRARFWKRGQRGIRLYYMLWQAAALKRARVLAADVRADLVWHLTLANVWLGSAAGFVGLPFVYGPVGGGIATQWRMLAGAPPSAVAYETGRSVARTIGRYLNPASRLAWSRASLILAQNDETRRWLPRRHRSKTVVFPNVVLDGGAGGASARSPSTPRTALFAGRLVFLKRVDLAIRAVALVEGWRLIVCGSGPEEERLRSLAAELGIADRVEFTGWLPRPRLLCFLKETADVLLFPSLHDEAGWIVAEALVNGVPVVCCDIGGPPAIAGPAAAVVAPTTNSQTVAGLAAALADGRIPSTSSALERGKALSREALSARLQGLVNAVGLMGEARA
jgi:glycosyltransferase involved in cell wall biosynthesis